MHSLVCSEFVCLLRDNEITITWEWEIISKKKNIHCARQKTPLQECVLYSSMKQFYIPIVNSKYFLYELFRSSPDSSPVLPNNFQYAIRC